MASPYESFAAKQADQETLRNVASLRIGKLYPVNKFVKVLSNFKRRGETIYSLKAHYCDGPLKFFSYLRTDFDNAEDDLVEKMNHDISDGNPSSLCFYGKLGAGNCVKLLEYGEEPDQATLNAVKEANTDIDGSSLPTKRRLNDPNEHNQVKVIKIETE